MPSSVASSAIRSSSRREEILAFSRALLGEQRITAYDQTLARIVGIRDLGEVFLVEERQLQ